MSSIKKTKIIIAFIALTVLILLLFTFKNNFLNVIEKKSQSNYSSKTTTIINDSLLNKKLECTVDDVEFMAYVTRRREMMTKTGSNSLLFLSKSEADDYEEYTRNLGYAVGGTSTNYENDNCKSRLYEKYIEIQWYNNQELNPYIKLPPTPKKDVIPVEEYLK